MDDEHTDGYREPCSQCSAVDWGVSDEGRFYCKSCHNVIERTSEVVDPSMTPGSSRVTTLSKRGRNKLPESRRRWTICEGFQFILRNQANALVKLGVSSQFKDEVLCQLWRLYLQKSQQAYTHNPVWRSQLKVRGLDSGSDSASEFSCFSASETDGGSNPPSTTRSDTEVSSDWSLCSGPLDGDSYRSARSVRLKRTRGPLSMVKTLALIHLALIWSREALTLSDLLRLVNEGYVPYVNAYVELPDEMQLEGPEALLFRVQSLPSYKMVHKEAEALIGLLKLPAFPPISRQNLLHPSLLSLRYLTDINLPDELHLWVCRLMDCAGMADEALHTCSGLAPTALPCYDLQAAALVIVTMKLLFGLDDHTEWDLSNQTGDQDDRGDLFNLRRWYRLLQAALTRAQQRKDLDTARKPWKADKLLYMTRNEKSAMMKKRRIAEQVKICFEKLSSRPAGVERGDPSSFRFCWGDEDGADGPSLHHKKLDGAVTLKDDVRTPSNSSYWHPALRSCKARPCVSHYSEVEPTLPRSFVWLLQLFSFLLDVKPAYLYEEVLRVERRVFSSSRSSNSRWRRSGRRPGTRTQQGQQTEDTT